MIEAHNGTVEVENPAEVLRDEDGVFQVTSPYGYVFQVTCHRGSRMRIREIIEPKRAKVPDRELWRIQRLSRDVA
jgi:hypothetical protein